MMSAQTAARIWTPGRNATAKSRAGGKQDILTSFWKSRMGMGRLHSSGASAATKKEGKRGMHRAKIILWRYGIGRFLIRRFWTVGDMEALSREGIRPILHNGKVAGWEVQRGKA